MTNNPMYEVLAADTMRDAHGTLNLISDADGDYEGYSLYLISKQIRLLQISVMVFHLFILSFAMLSFGMAFAAVWSHCGVLHDRYRRDSASVSVVTVSDPVSVDKV